MKLNEAIYENIPKTVPEYNNNIQEKRDLVEFNNKQFHYLTSLREVKDFINKI